MIVEATKLRVGDIFTVRRGNPLVRLVSVNGKSAVLTFFERDLFAVLRITKGWDLSQDYPTWEMFVICSGTSKKGPFTYIRELNFNGHCNFNYEFDKFFRLI